MAITDIVEWARALWGVEARYTGTAREIRAKRRAAEAKAWAVVEARERARDRRQLNKDSELFKAQLEQWGGAIFPGE